MTKQINAEVPLEPTSKKKSIKKSVLALRIFGGILLTLLVVFFVYLGFTAPLRKVDALLKVGKCVEAMPILDKLIEDRPNWVLPYERRVTCNRNMHSNVFTTEQGYLLAALQDTNTMIRLKPEAGGYYGQRDLVLRDMAPLEPYSVNQFAIYDLANQAVVKAIQLGVVPDSYVYRHFARNLIEGNHCEQGLAETQKLIDKSTMQSSDFAEYYSLYLTEGYMCISELDKALESAQYMTCDSPIGYCKTGLIASIYLQEGDYDNALKTINSMITIQPAGAGWRYFIRAMIYYEHGQKELAVQDLKVGQSYMWYETGVYWYIKAKLAFDAGDKEDGIALLQHAEQTLDVTYMPLRKQIIKELKAYGQKPIDLVPNLPFTLPPTP